MNICKVHVPFYGGRRGIKIYYDTVKLTDKENVSAVVNTLPFSRDSNGRWQFVIGDYTFLTTSYFYLRALDSLPTNGETKLIWAKPNLKWELTSNKNNVGAFFCSIYMTHVNEHGFDHIFINGQPFDSFILPDYDGQDVTAILVDIFKELPPFYELPTSF